MTKFKGLIGQTGVELPGCLQNKSNSFSAGSSSACHNPHRAPPLGHSRFWRINQAVSFSFPGLRIRAMGLWARSLQDSWRTPRWLRVDRKVTMPKRAAHAGTGPPNSCRPHLVRLRLKAFLYRMVTLSLGLSLLSDVLTPFFSSSPNVRYCNFCLPQGGVVPTQHFHQHHHQHATPALVQYR